MDNVDTAHSETANRLASLGLRPDQIARHVAGLAAAAALRRPPRHRAQPQPDLELDPECGPQQKCEPQQPLTLTPTQVEALMIILRAGPEPGTLWRWQTTKPDKDGAAWLWHALAHPTVGITTSAIKYDDRPRAVLRCRTQLRRLSLIKLYVARTRAGARQYQYVCICDAPPSLPLATVHRERLPAKPVVVRERLPPSFARRLPNFAAQADLGAGRSQVAGAAAPPA